MQPRRSTKINQSSSSASQRVSRPAIATQLGRVTLGSILLTLAAAIPVLGGLVLLLAGVFYTFAFGFSRLP